MPLFKGQPIKVVRQRIENMPPQVEMQLYRFGDPTGEMTRAQENAFSRVAQTIVGLGIPHGLQFKDGIIVTKETAEAVDVDSIITSAAGSFLGALGTREVQIVDMLN